MTPLSEPAAQAAIVAAAATLALPTVRTQAGEMADAAARDQLTHRGYLAELLASEVDDRAERRRIRRIREARFPRHKHLTDFDTTISPIDGATIATLAAGRFINTATPVVFLGDSGTGKTHLLIGAGLAACHTGHRVRCVTAASGRSLLRRQPPPELSGNGAKRTDRGSAKQTNGSKSGKPSVGRESAKQTSSSKSECLRSSPIWVPPTKRCRRAAPPRCSPSSCREAW
jgi:hypothetical protein